MRNFSGKFYTLFIYGMVFVNLYVPKNENFYSLTLKPIL